MRILLLVWRGWLLVASWVLVVVCVRFLGELGGESVPWKVRVIVGILLWLLERKEGMLSLSTIGLLVEGLWGLTLHEGIGWEVTCPPNCCYYCFG